jgi:hypothetical protein
MTYAVRRDNANRILEWQDWPFPDPVGTVVDIAAVEYVIEAEQPNVPQASQPVATDVTDLTPAQDAALRVSLLTAAKREIERRLLEVASIMDQHNTAITVALARQYLAGGLPPESRATLESAMPEDMTVADFVTNAESQGILLRKIKDVHGKALKAFIRDPDTTAAQLVALDVTAAEWWA